MELFQERQYQMPKTKITRRTIVAFESIAYYPDDYPHLSLDEAIEFERDLGLDEFLEFADVVHSNTTIATEVPDD